MSIPIDFSKLIELSQRPEANQDPSKQLELSAEDRARTGQSTNDFGATVIEPESHVEEEDKDAIIASLRLAIQTKDKQIAILAGADEATESSDAFESRIETGDDIFSEEEQKYLVESIIPADGVGQIYGPSTSGKTLLAVDLAMSLATGQSKCILGPLATDGPQHILYVALEGGKVHENYVRAWLLAHPEASRENFQKYFHRLDGAKGNLVTMSVDEKRVALPQHSWERFLKYDLDPMTKKGMKPAMVILDTQAYLMGLAEENSNSDMSKLYVELKTQANERDLLFTVVHHTGKESTAGGRGASSPFTICDSIIEVKRPKNRQSSARSYEIHKAKGAEDGMTGNTIIDSLPHPTNAKRTIGFMRSAESNADIVEIAKSTYLLTDDDLQELLKFVQSGEGMKTKTEIAKHFGYDKPREASNVRIQEAVSRGHLTETDPGKRTTKYKVGRWINTNM